MKGCTKQERVDVMAWQGSFLGENVGWTYIGRTMQPQDALVLVRKLKAKGIQTHFERFDWWVKN